MALWGVVWAREDGPEQAIRAALLHRGAPSRAARRRVV
jgi:hypothetical protein